MTNRFAIHLICMKCKWYNKNVDQKEKLHDVEKVTDLSYLGDGINSGGGCEAAVTSITRTGWVTFRVKRM